MSGPLTSIWILGKNYKVSDGSSNINAPLYSSTTNNGVSLTSDASSSDKYTEYRKMMEDVQSRIYLTYRYNFPSISSSEYTTDCGWGCMLRAAQMLLAELLVRHFLTRTWRKSEPNYLYRQIVSWFLDYSDKANCPFSIHALAETGTRFRKQIGEWFGPSTSGHVISDLVREFFGDDIVTYVSMDTIMYRKEILAMFKTKNFSENNNGRFSNDSVPINANTLVCPMEGKNICSSNFTSVCILIPLRLGVDNINSLYFPALKACFTMPQCLGIIGGRPNSAFYFLGFEGNNLLYLDPHFPQPVIAKKDLEHYHAEDFDSYHCKSYKKLCIKHADPSMLVAFFCKSITEFEDLCHRLQKLTSVAESIIGVADESPLYKEGLIDIDDFDLE